MMPVDVVATVEDPGHACGIDVKGVISLHAPWPLRSLLGAKVHMTRYNRQHAFTDSARMGDRSATADDLYQHGVWAWRSTARIVQITLTMTAGDFAAGSRATLWGTRAV